MREDCKINPVRNIRHSREGNKISNGVNCRIFQKQELLIKEVVGWLNEIEDYQHKVELASDLSRYADMLLECSEYNVNSLDCKNCRFISNLRKKTANIVIKAQKLAK